MDEVQQKQTITKELEAMGLDRRAFINSLRGKYAQVAISSDEFARKKQREIDRENRHR
ncbi:MAG: hypothetical protein AAF716_09935 [Cyanobacteria bacterium P01_D01_bin.1]